MEAQSWNNTDLASCLCWDTSAGDWCQGNSWDRCENYANSLWPEAVAGVVTLTFVFLVALGYLVARVVSCLWCTATLCCRTTSPTHPKAAYVYRATMLGMLVVYCVLAAALTGYRRAVTDGLDMLDDTMTAGTTDMNTRIAAFSASALPLAADLSVAAEVEPLLFVAVGDVSKWTKDANNVQTDTFRYLWAVDLFWWVLPMFFSGLLAFALANVHRVVPEIFFFFIALTAVYVSSVQACIAVSGAVAKDLCHDFDGVSHQMDLIMQSKLECGSVSGSLGEIPQTVHLLEAAYGEAAGNATGNVTALCTSLFACPAFGANTTLADFGSILYNASASIASSAGCQGCTIAACATSCEAGSAAQEASSAAVATFDTVDAGVRHLIATGYPLANCSVYQAMIASSHRPFCEGSKALSDTVAVYAGIAIGCAAVGAIMVFLNALANCIYTAARTPAAPKDAEKQMLMVQPAGSYCGGGGSVGVPVFMSNTQVNAPNGYGACTAWVAEDQPQQDEPQVYQRSDLFSPDLRAAKSVASTSSE